MATINNVFDSSASRGQLLIATSIIVAALLITLSMAFNAALFTEAKYTSTTFSDTERGDSLKNTHVTDIRHTMERENTQMDGEAVTDTETVIQNIDARTADRQTKYGAVVTLTHVGTTTGKRVTWTNPESNFTNADGNTTWVVTNGIGDIRAFELNFTSLSTVSGTDTATVEDEAFGVVLNPSDATNETRYFYRRDGDIHVKGVDESGTTTTTCSVLSSEDTKIKLTTGELDAEVVQRQCDGAWPEFGVDEIGFTNADAAEGVFEYTISSGAVAPNEESQPSELSAASAVYDVTVQYTYTTDTTRYKTEKRVTRGEP